jgi:hypothetical protein
MTRDELTTHVANTAEQCSNRVREALFSNRVEEAAEAAAALRDCAAAYRDLGEDDD